MSRYSGDHEARDEQRDMRQLLTEIDRWLAAVRAVRAARIRRLAAAQSAQRGHEEPGARRERQ